ncbi:MAG TPA: PA14 domain-containing protein, partial [Candidatus Rifleibacterium sp.]|nr:PA14 domain-containing protein [Candidatus Rifleibacterium sp.]
MVRLSGLKQKSLLFTLALVIWSFLFSTIAEAQPLPPINIAVTSRINNNYLTWNHNTQNPAGYVTNYAICRSTTYGATVQIATAAANATNFSDNTAGYSFDQEFYYTLRAISAGPLFSEPSEQVMRFLPTVGLTNANLATHTIVDIQYGSWKPYPGQWTDTIIYLRSTPDGGTNYTPNGDYVQRQIVRATRAVTLPVGGPYYFNVAIYAPDWLGVYGPANRRLVSYSSSRPFYVNPEVPYEDNASATFFNNSQNRVMAEPIENGVKAMLFKDDGGNHWRMRRQVSVISDVSRLDIPVLGNITPAKINAPCRVVFSGIPLNEITTTAARQVRVANRYGEELPCVVYNEIVSGASVTGFDVHFIANQDGTAPEFYWIYWGNPDADDPNYASTFFNNNLNTTSQFAVSPWFSRRIHRGGVETHSTADGARLIASPPSPIDNLSKEQLLAFTFPYFDHATTTVNVSTNGYISFVPHSEPGNSMAEFTGTNPQRFIAPLWCNLMENDSVPTDSGLFYQNIDNGNTRHHALFTWRANRYNATGEEYVVQAALYRKGDIALRYQTVNFGALTSPSISSDTPINIAPNHTAGISATDGTRWMTITDGTKNLEVTSLRDGSGNNVIHYFQSCHGWTTAPVADVTNSCAMTGLTCVGDYESRIFDGRSSAPTWSNIEYEITGGGAIDLYVRSSGTTTFPAWSVAAHRKGTDLTAGIGVITLTPNLTDRYVQYKLVFKKENIGDDPVLRRIGFGVGYIMIDNTTNQANGVDVSQGQTFLASMTYTNAFSGKLDTMVASLTFTPASSLQTWTRTSPLPLGVPTDESRTIDFSVTVATNSGNLDAFTVINGYVEAGSGSITLTSSSAITVSNYRVRKAAEMKIDFVDTPFERVNKGQGGLPVQVQVSNGSPYVPLIIDGASLSFSLGQYSITPEYGIDPLANGLYAAYFNTSNTNPPPFPAQQVATRIDNQVNFNWVTASPIPGVVTTDYFAVCWSGYVIPEFNENYTFYVNADDGTSLWVNGQLIINSWVSSASKRTSVTIPLNAGVPATILLETFERTGNARAELSWSSPSLAEEIIPSARLKPAYVLRGGQTMLLNFTVGIIDTSPSGVAYISATASGTNGWVPGLVTDSSNPSVIDSWIIQSPASLAIGLIQAPPIVYRGQANVPVEVEIINIGEADAQIASIPLFLSLGDYTDIIPGETMPVTITGGTSKFIKVLVSIQESTATGTADIDAEVSGIDANDGGDLDASGAALPAQWTILAEKILTYKDPSHLYPRTAFARPDSSTTDVHALAENLAPLKEYAIRFYDASGSEIISATTIAFSDPEGLLAAEYEIDSATPYGVYTIKITNSVNTYSPSQTSFRVVTTASVSASIVLPEKVSIGQNFAGVMTVNNSGGADALGMVPDPLTLTGPGTANILTGPNPAAPDITSNSLATITYTFLATGQGNYTVSAGASGFDASNDEPISAAYIDSNTCLIQTPALVSIAALTATPTFVSRYQRDIEVMVDLQNTGQADARITLADLRSPPNNNLTFGSATIASPTSLPAIVPGGSTATFTFRLTIGTAAPLGLASLTARIQYTDVNNPGPVTQVLNKILVFTVTAPNLLCYLNDTFTTLSYRYNAGTTVYAKASNLPADTNVRIRFYESNTPYTPTASGSGSMTPLNTGGTGIVSHPGYQIPIDTTSLNQWMVIVDDGDDAAVGPNIFARQFFYVYLPATYSISMNLGSSTCYAGDYVNAAVTVTNLSTWTTNIRQRLYTFNHTYAPDSAG